MVVFPFTVEKKKKKKCCSQKGQLCESGHEMKMYFGTLNLPIWSYNLRSCHNSICVSQWVKNSYNNILQVIAEMYPSHNKTFFHIKYFFIYHINISCTLSCFESGNSHMVGLKIKKYQIFTNYEY